MTAAPLIERSPALGRPLRREPVADLGRSSYALIAELAGRGDAAGAIAMTEYAGTYELQRVLDAYFPWLRDAVCWIRATSPHVPIEQLLDATLTRWLPATSLDEGEPGERYTRAAELFDCESRRALLIALGREGATAGLEQGRATVLRLLKGNAGGDVAAAVEAWIAPARALHDDMADWVWALATWVQEHVGEAAVESFHRASMGAWTTARLPAAQMRSLDPLELTRYSAETMRSHFSGVKRDGEIAVIDGTDRYELVLDPGGTCERMLRDGRTEPPYSFGVTREAYPWTWGRRGVSLYCAHCCLVNEIMPIEQTGLPKRVTEPPESPDAACRWLIYKDAREIPARYLERIGVTT